MMKKTARSSAVRKPPSPSQSRLYLVCDHYVADDGMSDGDPYMTIEELALALKAGGFVAVSPIVVDTRP
jgi:hypothetical protein